MSKVCDADTAAALIGDHQSVASTGVIGWITPDAVLAAIRRRYEATGSPRELTFFFPCATGDAVGIRGMDHVARKGLMRRIVSGSYINPRHPVTGARPALTELIQNDLVEAYNWPMGATMHWLREVARRGPGYLTRVGLGTYIDPRHGGGRFSGPAGEELVELVEFRGEEYLFYPTWPIDVGIVRAGSADEQGNLSFEDQPLTSSALAIALAVKACGGTVIAQVARIVPRGSRPARDVRIPGTLVDHVVVASDAAIGTGLRDDDVPGYLGAVPDALARLPRLPAGPDKVVARRVAREIRPGETSIFGFGGSSDAVLSMVEDGVLDGGRLHDYVFTTEHGSFGGVVMSGWQFSANYAPEALLDGASQFDFIDGGGCPFAALAFAQIDGAGNVNVSRFGAANPGAGGFIDIAAGARRLVFAGTFTTGGLVAECENGELKIVSEGAVPKFVAEADHVTYRIREGVVRGQRARIVTERAVFEVTAEGLVLIEVAPGIDPRRDVLDRIGFPVRVADRLATMDAALFRP
ncbi:CoA-transferase [Sphaerimonospora thailandensis]|uniref:Acetate CoA-transferase YdiF n=1 Tax=Sphaerimonospora thailandensis TaxID=795644 RepID=A0A8J3R5M7_9ACTN|nr:CoA-transferase [Sphaerimonospora thailandensis]GIH67797.1 acetate CoA-transferase YdiF [Sphaerimonospora thailandensis]